jgi:hypothetical protein
MRMSNSSSAGNAIPPESAKAKEADWYDQFYRSIQTELPPWYRAAIPGLMKALTPTKRLLELG